MKIHLDLRRDLAKVNCHTLGDVGDCRYSAPCAVGAMMTARQRKWLDDHDYDYASVVGLLSDGTVTVPDDQHEDLRNLQKAFDRNAAHPDRFTERLNELKAKYA